MTGAAPCPSSGVFFIEITIVPMWSAPMDIAPQYSGTAFGINRAGVKKGGRLRTASRLLWIDGAPRRGDKPGEW
jgi:hypothetical protein